MHGDDVWDDSAIIKAFQKAVDSHDSPLVTGSFVSVNSTVSKKAKHSNEVCNVDASEVLPERISVPNNNVTTETNTNPYGISDSKLYNLLMAWYNAGYQTGFYEGQKRESE